MENMVPIAKIIITTGAILIAVGTILLFLDKLPWIGKLPGDIYIQRKNFSLYLPITTCLIVSILVSAILYFLNKPR